MGTKLKPGQFDCYENAAPDEPMFVLLARDPLAPILVRVWADLREHAKGNSAKVFEARICAIDMEKWRHRSVLAPPPSPTGKPSSRPEHDMELEPSPNELAAAVETARRLGWNQEEITLAGWIKTFCHQPEVRNPVVDALRELINDLDCGSFVERHDLDVESMPAIIDALEDIVKLAHPVVSPRTET